MGATNLNQVEPGLFQITLKVFLQKEDRFLILRDYQSGEGDLPGGRIGYHEFMQDWHQALQREIHEELGEQVRFELSPQVIFWRRHLVEAGSQYCLLFAYEGQYLGGEIQLSHEHDEFHWVNRKYYQPQDFFTSSMLAAVQEFQQK